MAARWHVMPVRVHYGRETRTVNYSGEEPIIGREYRLGWGYGHVHAFCASVTYDELGCISTAEFEAPLSHANAVSRCPLSVRSPISPDTNLLFYWSE